MLVEQFLLKSMLFRITSDEKLGLNCFQSQAKRSLDLILNVTGSKLVHVHIALPNPSILAVVLSCIILFLRMTAKKEQSRYVFNMIVYMDYFLLKSTRDT